MLEWTSWIQLCHQLKIILKFLVWHGINVLHNLNILCIPHPPCANIWFYKLSSSFLFWKLYTASVHNFPNQAVEPPALVGVVSPLRGVNWKELELNLQQSGANATYIPGGLNTNISRTLNKSYSFFTQCFPVKLFHNYILIELH